MTVLLRRRSSNMQKTCSTKSSFKNIHEISKSNFQSQDPNTSESRHTQNTIPNLGEKWSNTKRTQTSRHLDISILDSLSNKDALLNASQSKVQRISQIAASQVPVAIATGRFTNSKKTGTFTCTSSNEAALCRDLLACFNQTSLPLDRALPERA